MTIGANIGGHRKRTFRAAIVIDPDIRSHVGVWTWIQSLCGHLRRFGLVDMVSATTLASSRISYQKLKDPNDGRPFADCEFESLCFSGSAKSVKRQYYAQRRKLKQARPADFLVSDIGNDAAVEAYDLAVIAAPWCARIGERFPAKQVVGIVYDLIPNEKALSTREAPLLQFASQHAIGYEYYDRHCDHVCGVSRQSAEAYDRFFHRQGSVAKSLPPLVPLAYHARTDCPTEREATVALASPFDVRKGLVEIPALLAQLPNVEQVLIYGARRCSNSQLYAFLDALGQKQISWWPKASAKQVAEIFSRAKLLMFPSWQEGLGLPIIEAQLCGCPVMVRDREPMRSLVMPGTPLLRDSLSDATADLAAFQEASDSPAAIQDWAYRTFDPKFVDQFLIEQLSPLLSEQVGVNLDAAPAYDAHHAA